MQQAMPWFSHLNSRNIVNSLREVGHGNYGACTPPSSFDSKIHGKVWLFFSVTSNQVLQSSKLRRLKKRLFLSMKNKISLLADFNLLKPFPVMHPGQNLSFFLSKRSHLLNFMSRRMLSLTDSEDCLLVSKVLASWIYCGIFCHLGQKC